MNAQDGHMQKSAEGEGPIQREHSLVLHNSCWFHALLGSFLPHGLLHAHSLLHFLRE